MTPLALAPRGAAGSAPGRRSPGAGRGERGPHEQGQVLGGTQFIASVSVLCSAVSVKPLQATRKSITGKLPLLFFFFLI